MQVQAQLITQPLDISMDNRLSLCQPLAMNDLKSAAQVLGKAGGRAGRGPAKSHGPAIRAFYASPAGQRKKAQIVAKRRRKLLPLPEPELP